MEQKVYIRLDAGFHSALHAKNIEHVHAGKQLPVGESRYSRNETECVEAVLSFDEGKVAGWLNLSAEHQYDFATDISMPTLEEGALQYDSYNSRILVNRQNVGQAIQRTLVAACTTSMNIDSIIDGLRSQHARLDSPEALELIAKGEKENAEKRALENAEKKRKEEEWKKAEELANIEKKRLASLKRAWISEHGSERLRKGSEKGYSCEKLFTIELVASLSSDFVLDYDGKVSTKARSCPTLAALLRVEELEKSEWIDEARVCWLPQGFAELEEEPSYEEPQGFEAIEIEINGHYAYKEM